jgi:hypothetical protein
MTHREQITVFEIIQTPDGYGGTYETLSPLTNAPTWASIHNSEGNQIQFGAYILAPEYLVKCNYIDGFDWKPDMVVLPAGRFNYMKVSAVVEVDRFRGIKLLCNTIDSEQWQLQSV